MNEAPHPGSFAVWERRSAALLALVLTLQAILATATRLLERPIQNDFVRFALAAGLLAAVVSSWVAFPLFAWHWARRAPTLHRIAAGALIAVIVLGGLAVYGVALVFGARPAPDWLPIGKLAAIGILPQLLALYLVMTGVPRTIASTAATIGAAMCAVSIGMWLLADWITIPAGAVAGSRWVQPVSLTLSAAALWIAALDPSRGSPASPARPYEPRL